LLWDWLGQDFDMGVALDTVNKHKSGELERLAKDLSRIWIGNANFRDSLEVLCRYGMRMTDADSVTAWLLEGRQLRPAATSGQNPTATVNPDLENYPDLESNHPAACAVRERELQTIAPESVMENSTLAVPILVDAKALGALVFQRQGVSFELEDLAGAEVLASQAAFSFRMLRRARELELVYEVTRAISTSLNLEEVVESIHQGLSRVLPTDNFYIAFYDEASKEIRFPLEYELGQRKAPRKRPAAAGLTEYLLASKRPLLIPSHFDETCQQLDIHFSGRPARCWMGAPMVFRDRAVGVMAVQSYEHDRLFDDDHLSVLYNVASQAAGAIAHARLFSELRASYEDLQFTQQRLLQSEKLAAVGQLISGIAHELNNPLTGVVGWTQYLLGQNPPATFRTHLNTINAQAQRASRIVNNLLTFSRQHRPERCAVAIHDVIESTLALRAYELRVNNIEVHRDFAAGIPTISADPHQLQQILLNLIINAEQAILGVRQSGNLYLKTELLGESIQISVADDGPGMSADLVQKIFDPFFTTKPIGTGTGLGLSISYGIVQEHGGRIWATSEPGRGAKFYMTLPCTAAGVQAATQAAAPPPAPAASMPRVLIVDDEDSVRELLATLLEGWKLAIDSAATGEEALEKATASHYDLVLSDLKMPGLGGAKFYDRLNEKLGPRTPRFIFMTGDVLGEENQQLLDRTQSLCILKPFDIFQAREIIQQGLRAATPEQESQPQ
jgi:signal transduction histidine kinase/CheY-like chemotaxis protein